MRRTFPGFSGNADYLLEFLQQVYMGMQSARRIAKNHIVTFFHCQFNAVENNTRRISVGFPGMETRSGAIRPYPELLHSSRAKGIAGNQ